MPTVAEQLRAGREARKLTIPQVAEATKIRTDHIRALEEGNFNVFSAPVYIRGFVRNYATQLKLDVPQVMAAARRRTGPHGKIQRTAAADRGIQNRARPPDVLARPAELADGSRRHRRRGNCFNRLLRRPGVAASPAQSFSGQPAARRLSIHQLRRNAAAAETLNHF